MPPRPDDILTLGIELDSKKALQAMDKFQRAMKTEMQAVTKTVQNLGKFNKKAMQDAVEGTKDYLDQLDDLQVAHSKEAKALDNISRKVDALREKQEKATDAEKAGIEEVIKTYEKEAEHLSHKVSTSLFDRAAANKTKKDLVEAMEGAVDGFKPVFQSFFSKDLKGLVEESTKGLGKILGKGLTKGAGAAFKRAHTYHKRGDALQTAGAERGGIKGTAMNLAGGAMKMAGGAMGKIGGLLESLSKLGPILSMVSGFVVGIAKMFIDAQAQAKAFNKDLLQSASTAEFLGANGDDVNGAFGHLEDTLKSIRDEAYNAKKNLEWGTTADDHKAVLNVLTQEGVSLLSISESAKTAKKDVGAFAGELVHMGVAYSRAFGVPIQEITQMQSEMMTELGMGLDSTKLAFAQMTRSAEDSGIAANKFFATIRSVSSDLSLYNVRLEDAVKTLRLLGKVMSPREAGKFMQYATKALKGMGTTDRLKMNLLGGGGKNGMSELVNRDLDRKSKDVSDKIGEAGGAKGLSRDDLMKKSMSELMAGVQKDKQGELRSAISEMRMDDKARQKGVFGVGVAGGNLGAPGALQAMKNSLNITGKGKLRDRMGDLGTQKLAENNGISEESLRGMAKFEEAIDDERETLKKELKKGPKADKKIMEKLAKEGLKTAEDIDGAGFDQIYALMDDGQKADYEKAKTVEEYAKKQGDLTQSLIDKLGVLTDWFMNQLYNVFVDIYEAILEIPGVGNTKMKENAKSLRAARDATAGKKDVSDIATAADPKKAIADSGIMKSMKDVFAKANELRKNGKDGNNDKAINELLQKKANDGGLSKEDQAKLDNLKKEAIAQQKVFDTEQKLIDGMGSFNGNVMDWTDAMKKAGVSQDKIDEFGKKYGEGRTAFGGKTSYGVAKDMQNSGTLSTEDLAKIAQQLPTAGNMKGSERTAGMAGVANTLKDGGFYDDAKATAKASETTADATANIDKHATHDGTLFTKFSTPLLEGKYKKTMGDVFLDSLRTALFENFMYSKQDPKTVAKYLGDNKMSPKDFAAKTGDQATLGNTPDDWMQPLDGNDDGGVVTGVQDGVANVTAAAGEGLASIGQGERIVPSSGGMSSSRSGGKGITINVNGVGGNDLAKIIHAKVVDGIAEYKRRERMN